MATEGLTTPVSHAGAWPLGLLRGLRSGRLRLPQVRARTRGRDWAGLRRILDALPSPVQASVRVAHRGAVAVVWGRPASFWQLAAAARQLPAHGEAALLAFAERDRFGRAQWLQPVAQRGLTRLLDAAQSQGVQLEVVSSFRSVRDQTRIVSRKLAQGQSVEQILAVNAPPGYSEHHTGCAVDFAVPGAPLLTEAFEDSAAFSWLLSNAVRFGFRLSYPRDNRHGVIYEPWHWFHVEER